MKLYRKKSTDGKEPKRNTREIHTFALRNPKRPLNQKASYSCRGPGADYADPVNAASVSVNSSWFSTC